MANREQLITRMARILMLSFFMPPGIQTLLLICLGGVIAFFALKDHILLSKKDVLQCLALSGTYVCYLAMIPFTHAPLRSDLLAMIETKAGLIILPFLTLVLIKLFPGKLIHQLAWFVYGCAVVSLGANIIILWQGMNEQALLLSQHVAYRHAFESVTGIHPTYFGMYICFALAIMWVHPAWFPKSRMFAYLLQVVLMTSLFLLTPKAAIMALTLSGIYYLIVVSALKGKEKWLLVSILAGSLLFLYLYLPVFNQRVNEVFRFFSQPVADLRNNSVEVRHLIFQIDMDLLRQHWVTGMGPAALNTEFMQRSWTASLLSGYPFPIYNTHNEYLNQWISFGLAGILIFLASLAIQVNRALYSRNHLYRLFLMITLVIFFTENVLSRQQGVVYFAFFTSFLFFQAPVQYEKEGENSTFDHIL